MERTRVSDNKSKSWNYQRKTNGHSPTTELRANYLITQPHLFQTCPDDADAFTLDTQEEKMAFNEEGCTLDYILIEGIILLGSIVAAFECFDFH